METAAPYSQTEVGHSKALSYEEALKDAISRLNKPSNSDFLNVEVVSTRVFIDGLIPGTDLQITVLATTAAKATLASREIEIEGCLKNGVEAGCLILTTRKGESYSLHGTNLPGLDKRLVVRVKGSSGGVSQCVEGAPFSVTSWDWTRQSCPE
jgi:hypothetical protein